MFHFLFCISPLDLSFFPMFISRNFFHLHRFSLLYFSIVFSSPLYNKQSISNLFIEVILLDSSNPWANVLNSCDTLEKAVLWYLTKMSQHRKEEIILFLRYAHFDIKFKIFHLQLSLWHIHSLVYPVLLFMLGESFSNKFTQFSLTESAHD